VHRSAPAGWKMAFSGAPGNHTIVYSS
jgi:hypothetical protein